MFISLLIACVSPPKAEPSDTAALDGDVVDVDYTINGVTLEELEYGFAVVDETSDRAAITVILTSYPDPCDVLAGYWNELAELLLYQPELFNSSGWAAEQEAVGAAWFPAEAHDTLTLTYRVLELGGALEDAYTMDAGGTPRGGVGFSLVAGQEGGGSSYDRFDADDGGSAEVTALDPVTSEGAGPIRGDMRDNAEWVYGTVEFSYKVGFCPAYTTSVNRWEDAYENLSSGC